MSGVMARGKEACSCCIVLLFFFSPNPLPPSGSCGKPAKNRAAAIKAEFAFQQPTLHVGRLTLHGFSSSNIAEWEGSIPVLFILGAPSITQHISEDTALLK